MLQRILSLRLVRSKPMMVQSHTREQFDKIDNWFTCPSRICDSRATIAHYSSYCPECGIALDWEKDFTA